MATAAAFALALAGRKGCTGRHFVLHAESSARRRSRNRMSENSDLLKDIVEIARDGATFYAATEDKTKNPRLKAVFARMAAAKRELVTALSDHLAATGER